MPKLWKKIIFTQLSSYFNEHKLIFDNQYGFRPKHSTEYAALELVDRIITQMDKKEAPINIFLDLSKAFDTIDQTCQVSRITRESHGFWQFLKAHGRETLNAHGYL